MKITSVKTISGSVFAFLAATACCWIPWLAIAFGGATLSAGLLSGLEKISLPFFIIGGLFLVYAGYSFFQKNKKSTEVKVVLESVLTCPECGFQKEETMPTNACQFFYECESCKTVLKPQPGDCCVYCSYGTVACPPIQEGEACC